MTKQRIMYVCSECADGCPEACGHYDRNELRVMPDGMWLCESCFDNNDDNEFLSWGHLPAPEEYGRIPASAQTSPEPEVPNKLPCDVHLPPHTVIRKGCDWKTLLVAIKQRETWEDEHTRFPKPMRPLAQTEGENPIGQGLRRTQQTMCAADMEAKIAALAHRFWSIHPSSLDDMGLTREEFYAHEMTNLLASTLPEGNVAQGAAQAGRVGSDIPAAWRWHEPGEVRWRLDFVPPSSPDIVKEPLYAPSIPEGEPPSLKRAKTKSPTTLCR